jgi:hypothetical protein
VAEAMGEGISMSDALDERLDQIERDSGEREAVRALRAEVVFVRRLHGNPKVEHVTFTLDDFKNDRFGRLMDDIRKAI